MFKEFFEAWLPIFVNLAFSFYFFYFEEIVIMLNFLLAFLTKAEVWAFNTLIPNSNDRVQEASFALKTLMY